MNPPKYQDTERVPQAELPVLATRVLAALEAGPAPFCLWLIGDLGAGKTTLARHLLRGLGVPAHVPVTSPTYTYMNEYRTPVGVWYAHLDLYRAKDSFSLEDLGLVDARRYRGFLVEWPEAIPKNPAIDPTHVLTLNFTDDPDVRQVSLVQSQA